MVIVLKVSFSFPAFKSILLILVNSIGQSTAPVTGSAGEAEGGQRESPQAPGISEGHSGSHG